MSRKEYINRRLVKQPKPGQTKLKGSDAPPKKPGKASGGPPVAPSAPAASSAPTGEKKALKRPAAAPQAVRRVDELTAAEIAAIADGLRGGMNNVFGVIRHAPYCIADAGDAIFERLEKETGLCRCVECGMWRDKTDMDAALDDFCRECVEEMNGEAVGGGDS